MDIKSAKHAFITGGASGIGLGIADALASRGIFVTIADINNEALNRVLADRTEKFRGQLLDTRNREAWAQAGLEAEAAFGPVDILVNNAGIAPDGREFADMDPASFDRIVGINLTGVFNGVSTFAAAMRERKAGHIVNTASLAGICQARQGLGAYAVSKFGVVALSECLRIEMEPHGVGVSVLCPGMVATNLPENTLRLGGDLRDSRSNSNIMASGLSPADLAEQVIDAIELNSLYIISHTDSWPSVEKRLEDLREAFKK